MTSIRYPFFLHAFDRWPSAQWTPAFSELLHAWLACVGTWLDAKLPSAERRRYVLDFYPFFAPLLLHALRAVSRFEQVPAGALGELQALAAAFALFPADLAFSEAVLTSPTTSASVKQERVQVFNAFRWLQLPFVSRRKPEVVELLTAFRIGLGRWFIGAKLDDGSDFLAALAAPLDVRLDDLKLPVESDTQKPTQASAASNQSNR
jgi:hypothetical protein